MKAAADTTLTIAADPKHLGGRIGVTAVLHTWGSPLTHHPHVHMVSPEGAHELRVSLQHRASVAPSAQQGAAATLA